MENESSLYGPCPERRGEQNLTWVGTSRCDVPAREAAGGTVAPRTARTAQRAVLTRFRDNSANSFGEISPKLCRRELGNVKMHPCWTRSGRFGHCCEPLLLRRRRAGFARLAPFVQVSFNLFHCRLIQFVEEHENEQRNHAD